MEKNFNLIEATAEDEQNFKKGLDELCKYLSLEMGLYINKIPIKVKTSDELTKSVLADEPVIQLRKKVEVPDTSEPEVKVTDVKVEPTISPFVPQAPTDETNTDTKTA